MHDMIAGLSAVFLLQTAEAPKFEVAFVKPSKSESGTSNVNSCNGRVHMRNVILRRCIRRAYGMPDAQIPGGPKWLDENRFTIVAKAAGPANDAEIMMMVRPLPAECFNLLVHSETRTLSGYALVIAKGGLKAKPSAPGAHSRTDTGRGSINMDVCSM
jgi:uncharacterized protein (TIGR03435 family)